jgi:hypothetical protein
MFVWTLAKHTCERLRNIIMPLGLDFMPLDQISNMSLNGLRRQFATQNKTIIDPHMDEPFISLDLGHPISSMGTPPSSVRYAEKEFVGGSPKLGFFLVRYNAISEQVVDFEENCVRK